MYVFGSKRVIRDGCLFEQRKKIEASEGLEETKQNKTNILGVGKTPRCKLN